MLTDNQITKLEKNGFSRWTKGDHDRLYINATHQSKPRSGGAHLKGGYNNEDC